MEQAGLIDRLLSELYGEKVDADIEVNAPPRLALNQRRADLLVITKQAGATKDIDLILQVEKAYIVNDLNLYGNSKDMRGSLSEALAGLKQTERMVSMVRDPDKYAIVDETHALKKSRKAGLPYDEARKYFPGQVTRLRNMDKSRLSAEEKQIINQRQQNLRTAEGIYKGMQSQALGVSERQPDQSRGLERE